MTTLNEFQASEAEIQRDGACNSTSASLVTALWGSGEMKAPPHMTAPVCQKPRGEASEVSWKKFPRSDETKIAFPPA